MVTRLGLAIAAVLLGALSLLAAAQSPGADQRLAPGSGKDMCAALAPSDFVAQGLPVSGLKSASIDGDGANAYCSYDSKAGSIELDVFFPAADNAAAVIGVERTTFSEIGARFQPVSLPGVDDAQVGINNSAKPPSMSIVVRKANAVFALSVPATDQSRNQLIALARLVAGRIVQTDRNAR